MTMNITGGLLGSISLTTVAGGATSLLGNLLVPGYSNPVFTLQSSPEGQYGTLTLNSNGTYSYNLTAYGISESHKLGEGETASDVFLVRATASGKSVITPVTFTITGVNDAPTIQQAYLSVSEDDVSAMYGQLVIADPDRTDTPQAVPQTTAGLYGTFYLNANGSYTYVLNKDSAAVTALNDGDTLNDVFTVTVVDGHGGSAQTTVTVTINGSGEAPQMQGMGAMRLAFIPDDLDDLDGTEQNLADAAAEENGNAIVQDSPHADTSEGASAGDEAAQAGQSTEQEAPQPGTESADAPANTPAEDSGATPEEANSPEDSAHADTGHASTEENAASEDHAAQSGQEVAQDPSHDDTASTEPAPDTPVTDATHESLHTGADLVDTDRTDMGDTYPAHTDNHFLEMIDDILDEELANSFMNDHIGPLSMDIEDAFLSQTQGGEAVDGLQHPEQQNDSLFPVEPENLADTGDMTSVEPSGQGQGGVESSQIQDAGAPSPGTDLMESEADQMAVLQHLTQNGH